MYEGIATGELHATEWATSDFMATREHAGAK